MAIIGTFMGGSPGSMIAAGTSVLNLHWTNDDGVPVDTGSFTVTGPGFNKTVKADAGGRTTLNVPAGQYTVTINHSVGECRGDSPQVVVAEARMSYLVYFNLTVPPVNVRTTWE